MKFNDMKPQVFALAQEAENEIRSQFERIDRIAQLNTLKVMQAFQDNKVSDSCLPERPAMATTMSAGKCSTRSMHKFFARMQHLFASVL